MKANVDLTLERVFRDKREVKAWRHELCDECYGVIKMPWRDYCSKCEAFFSRIGFRKRNCRSQLTHSYYKKGKISCCNQLHYSPNYDKGRKIRFRKQMGETSWHIQKPSCLTQLRSIQ